MKIAGRTKILQPEFIVEPYLGGVRVDSFLSRHLRNYTTWRLHRLVSAGLCWINDLPADPDQRVRRDQVVRIRLAEPPDKLLSPSSASVPILYEDPWLLVVNKPAGMVAHPVGDYQDNTLTNVLQRHLDNQTSQRGLLRAGIVHRLDRQTSGLLVVTRTHDVHREISADMQAGRLKKSYLALVEGHPDFNERTISLPIGWHPAGRSVLMSAKPNARRQRSALTQVRVLQRRRCVSLLECKLFTGRNHQIRVHLAECGHPIVGDEFYGSNGEIRSKPQSRSFQRRHALHAAFLQFRHPIFGRSLSFTAPPGHDFFEV